MIVDGPKEQAKRGAATIGDFIREQRQQAQVSVRQLARLAGVSNPYLSQIERGMRKPSAEILQQIAKGLRISAEQLYVRAGILEFHEGNQDIVDGDPGRRGPDRTAEAGAARHLRIVPARKRPTA